MTGVLDRYFKISERGSTVARELRGGLVTFLTMAYIVVLNPIILSGAPDATGEYLGGGTEPGAGFATIAAVTALVAGVMSIVMGLVANFPLAIAAGLGLNAFVAFSVASQMTWADAMGLVVIEGIIILILVLTGFRKAVFDAVPRQLKTAIAVGIGLFITLIGLVNAGFVRTTGEPSPPLGLGIGGSLSGWPVAVFCIGLLVMIGLYANNVRGAILIGIVFTTILAVVVQAITDTPSSQESPTGWNLNVPSVPSEIVAKPDFSLLGQFNLLGSFESVGVVAAILLVFSLMLADFFDTMGTMTAVGAEAGLNDEDGAPKNTQRILVVDSLGAVAGGMGSVSSNTAYVESASGVGDGARTGLASVTTGVLFLLATLFTPLVQAIPNEAAVAALVVVGFLMMTQVTGIDWSDLEIAIPAFLTIVLMPFTYSITVGIGAGFLAFVFLKVARGKIREIHVLMWIISVLFLIYFLIDPISNLLGV
ncbi:NCS2 family permease [Aeromicrobium camelliae]|uniref:NCS2 family permease n=1 Tax=Aeromicrobium camelliae TaxID=1538144 RepID=A0A3N6ZRZ0_9ACTN|nr:NCS2 family permease [Aeromicrobium camelliae]RQN09767.1 NCS2 family permease [Aeromicrobium camelliae]